MFLSWPKNKLLLEIKSLESINVLLQIKEGM